MGESCLLCGCRLLIRTVSSGWWLPHVHWDACSLPKISLSLEPSERNGVLWWFITMISSFTRAVFWVAVCRARRQLPDRFNSMLNDLMFSGDWAYGPPLKSWHRGIFYEVVAVFFIHPLDGIVHVIFYVDESEEKIDIKERQNMLLRKVSIVDGNYLFVVINQRWKWLITALSLISWWCVDYLIDSSIL